MCVIPPNTGCQAWGRAHLWRVLMRLTHRTLHPALAWRPLPWWWAGAAPGTGHAGRARSDPGRGQWGCCCPARTRGEGVSSRHTVCVPFVRFPSPAGTQAARRPWVAWVRGTEELRCLVATTRMELAGGAGEQRGMGRRLSLREGNEGQAEDRTQGHMPPRTQPHPVGQRLIAGGEVQEGAAVHVPHDLLDLGGADELRSRRRRERNWA